MMSNNRRQYYTRYRERHIAIYSEATRTYPENNRDEINVHHRNAHRRNMGLSRLHNENEYLGEILSEEIPPLSIGTLSEECINRGAISFLVEHGRTKHNCCHHGTVELCCVNYTKALKNLLLISHSHFLINFH